MTRILSRGPKRLDQVGVTLNPPSITIYEGKGNGGDLGDALIDIRTHGPEADALKEAIARGDAEITYELVRSLPSGKITLLKFHLDTQPTLPNRIINKN